MEGIIVIFTMPTARMPSRMMPLVGYSRRGSRQHGRSARQCRKKRAVEHLRISSAATTRRPRAAVVEKRHSTMPGRR